MKKRFLAGAMCTAMAVTLLAGCNKGQTPAETTPAQTQEQTQEQKADLPEAKYYYSFDEKDGDAGFQAVIRGDGLEAIDNETKFVTGVKGDALYVDATCGYKLTEVNGVGTTYSVSYWLNSSRLKTFMPTVQFGPDVDGNGAEGAEHWMNITYNNTSDDGGDTFPYIWTYDASKGDRIGQSVSETDTRLNKWVHVVVTVDESERSADGSMALAHLYLDGEEYVKVNAEGEVDDWEVYDGIMASTDSFNFLLGINFWSADGVMKGAYDELYIFDKALSASEVKALYNDGDASATYTAPEHEFVVEQNPDAIESIGTTDLTLGWWSDFTSTYEITAEAPLELTFKNYSDGGANWDNFVAIFTSAAHDAHVDPNTVEGSKEYVVARADAWAWIGEQNPDTNPELFDMTWTWGNWENWLANVMRDATVKMVISRDGGDIIVKTTLTDYVNATYSSDYVLHTELTDADPLFVSLTGEKAYIEVLKVGHSVVVAPVEGEVEHVGTTDLTTGFWLDWSKSVALADGETKTLKFTNFGMGTSENWDNFVLVFANVETPGHIAPADTSADYGEYAVLRGDAFGWGDADFAYTTETSWGTDWDTFCEFMKKADVTLTINRSGETITVDAVFVAVDGTEYTEKYVVTDKNLVGGDCHFFLTGENCYLSITEM